MSKSKEYTSNKGNKYNIHGGVYTGYSCTNLKTNKSSVYGFDNPDEVKHYINKAENGSERSDIDGAIEKQD